MAGIAGILALEEDGRGQVMLLVGCAPTFREMEKAIQFMEGAPRVRVMCPDSRSLDDDDGDEIILWNATMESAIDGPSDEYLEFVHEGLARADVVVCLLDVCDLVGAGTHGIPAMPVNIIDLLHSADTVVVGNRRLLAVDCDAVAELIQQVQDTAEVLWLGGDAPMCAAQPFTVPEVGRRMRIV
uniref:Uncharacterized protein n=1 Tax=Zooxanthella nutricula TaxID=1333877 RepID=A0A6U6GE95_9DINO|mmetsp:Transcript_103081/g.315365  ORF Transcript_103081/g.315365 Transcript_103081/m.315365 type:complete len:184 (+) Transcript_103081:22-573(+)